MDVLVDGVVVDGAFAQGKTLEEALRHIQANLCKPEHLVMGLRCNGEDIPANGMDTFLKRSSDEVERLEVLTNTRCAVVADAMEEASKSLSQTADAVTHIVELLATGKTADALGGLAKCMTAWQQVHQAVVHSIGMMSLDLQRETINGESLADLLTQPKDVLTQVRDALKTQDHVLLADLLEYELAGVTRPLAPGHRTPAPRRNRRCGLLIACPQPCRLFETPAKFVCRVLGGVLDHLL